MSPTKNGDAHIEGDWLFRQEGLVLGPVSAKKLVEMLYAGQIDGRTEIAPMGSPGFLPLARVEAFRVPFAKAEAKRRVDLTAAQDKARSARVRNVKALVIAVSGVILLGAATSGAWYLATNTGNDDLEAYALANISVDPPKIWGTTGSEDAEELLEYPGAAPAPAKKPTAAATAAATPRPSPSKPAPIAAATTTKAQKPSRKPAPSGAAGLGPADTDGMQTAQFDQGAINKVVSQNQKRLFGCFKEEAERTPGFAAKIPLEFVIGNDGRVAKLWVDNPRYKNGPLYDCLFRELQKWPFKAYDGERATVGLSFNIGKR